MEDHPPSRFDDMCQSSVTFDSSCFDIQLDSHKKSPLKSTFIQLEITGGRSGPGEVEEDRRHDISAVQIFAQLEQGGSLDGHGQPDGW